MKTFATPEYIKPIIDEIKANYTPENSPATLAALDCVALLHKIGSRDYMAIRTPEKGNADSYRRLERIYKAALQSKRKC